LPHLRQVRKVAVAIWYFGSTVAFAMITASCASALPPRADGDACIPERVFTSGEDKVPMLLQGRKLLRPEMLKGQYFEVDDRVRTDGFVNTYVVASPYGTSKVCGDDQLRYRENEYEVLGALDEYGVTRPMVFGLGVVNGAENYVEGAFQMLVWPVRSIAGVPKGVYKYGARINEMTRERRTFYEDSYAQELIGFSQSKREFAGRLGVDAYSTSQPLQQRLNELSWASWAGGTIPSIGTVPVSGPAGYALTAAGTPENMHLVNLDTSPEDLRIDNARKLKKMGVGKSLRDELIDHPWFSPRHRTILVDSLDKLGNASGRPDFVKVAVGADSESEAFGFQRLAELLRAYHEYASPIDAVMMPNGRIMARAKDGSVVVPMLADYGLWTPSTRALVEELERASPTSAPSARRVFWITGRLSPEMAAEMQARGWQVEENISERHLLAYEYQEQMAIKDRLFGQRILPRIGD
jgi:hypothetical protein